MNAQRLHEATMKNIALQPHEKLFLRQEIDTRKQLVARLTSEYQSYEALLSPLRQCVLPAEILGEIFIQVLALASTSVDAQLRDICLVCSAWRQVALSTPQLWCSIQNILLDPRKKVYFDRAKAWLMRGRSLSKSLKLVEYCDEDSEEACSWALDEETLFGHAITHSGGHVHKDAACPALYPSLGGLLSEIPSLEKLSISCLGALCFQAALLERICSGKENCSQTWDSLLSLELDIDGVGCGGLAPKADLLRQLPPSLNHLKLDLPCFLDILDEHVLQPLSLQSLTALELTMSSWPTHWILHCAESCPKLQNLTIDLYDIDADWDSVGPSYPAKQRYHLPYLLTLRFRRFRDRHSTTAILRLLMTPSLVELDIAFDCQRDNPGNADDVERDPLFPAFADDMKVFMKQPGCVPSLRRLRITNVYLPWVTLKPILNILHSITHLTLDDVWARWSENPWPVWPAYLVPRLESLEVFNMDDTFDPDTILRYVQTRQKQIEGLSCIKRVNMSMYRMHTDSSRYPNKGAIARRLRQYGVEVKIDVERSNEFWRSEWRPAVHEWRGALASPFIHQ